MGYLVPIIFTLLVIVVIDTWINSRIIRKELEVIKKYLGIKDENDKSAEEKK